MMTGRLDEHMQTNVTQHGDRQTDKQTGTMLVAGLVFLSQADGVDST
jgi:hypothetical protein